MSVQIQKLKVNGQVIYPATILDAIKDGSKKITVNGEEVDNPSYGKTVREIITENEHVTSTALTDLDSRVGTLTSLTTDAKTDLVSALNEVDANSDAIDSRVETIENLINADEDGTINKVNEIISWFNGLDEDSQVATELISDVAANKEAIGTEATDEEEATGIYKTLSDLQEAIDAKNVDAEGESGDGALVEASVSDNTVTVSTTTKLQEAVTSAESALQNVSSDTEEYATFSDKDANEQVLTINTSSIEDGATGLASAADVYAFAATVEASTDDTEYEDVF